MRTFDLVDFKVGESNYFLEKLFKSRDLIEVRYLFSAYVSASRSITFCLQASLSDLDGFAQWYELHQTELKRNSLAKFFVEARNVAQKIGAIPISSGSYKDGAAQHYFDRTNIEFESLPKDSVEFSCVE